MAKNKESPTKIIEQLKPGLRDLYSKLSPEVASLMAELLHRADGLNIEPNRLVKYALLRAAAERDAGGAAISREHTSRAKAELAGNYHAFEQGYEYNEEAWQRHRRGRKARQRIASSLSGVQLTWQSAQGVIEKNRQDLPANVRSAVSAAKLKIVADMLREMYRAVDLADAKPSKGSLQKESTLSIRTFVLWDNLVPKYKGRWRDMHELALAWRLTQCSGTDSFRLMVRKSSSSVEQFSVPFGTAWMAALTIDS